METSRRTVLASAAAAGLTASFAGTSYASAGRTPTKELFGRLADGTKVYRWSLANGGTRMKVLSYGGIVQSLELPDRHGRYTNVSLGYDTIEAYVAGTTFFGALIGRYGNRIAKGRFTLDGKTHQLSVNDGENSLHGGAKGFNTRVWDVEPFAGSTGVGLVLRYVSVDGEMGYPGTLRVKVTYTLTARGDWRIDYA
ncbi:galactose-1-epimerase, partial [Streptomyces sp. NPDC057302]